MKKMMDKLLHNRIVRNAGWLIGGKAMQMLIHLLVGILTARYLGPSNYGLIHYAGAYTAFFSAICTLGINSVLVKEFVDLPGEEGKILGTSLVLRAVASFLSAVVIVCIVFVVDAGETDTILVVALSSMGLLFHIFEVFNYWFQSRLQSRVTAIVTLVAYTVTAAYKVFSMISGKNVAFFALATSLDYLCVALLLVVAYKRHSGGRLRFSWEYGKRLLTQSWHFILPGLMVAIYGQTDKLMLKQMIDEAEIGYYSTAVAISTAWTFVLAAIIDSMFPSIMEANKNHDPSFDRKNVILYAIVFYTSMAVSVVFCLFAKPIITLMYGKAYLPAVLPLQIVTWYTAFSYLGVARNAWVVCKNRQKYLFVIYLSAALSNVCLNLLLIPRWGAAGAAVASLTAQIVTTMVTPFLIPGMRENSRLMIDAILLRGLLVKKRKQTPKSD